MSKHRSRRPGIGRLRPPPGLRPTRGGLFFLSGTLFICLAALDSDSNLLLLLLGLCLAAILVSVFSGWRTLRGLAITRVAPDVLVARQAAVFRYAITNRRSWGVARGILVEDLPTAGGSLRPPEAYLPHLAAGETAMLSAPVLPQVRGRALLTTIRVSTTYPFGIFRKAIRLRSEHELVVFPALGRLLREVTRPSRACESTMTERRLLRTAGDEEYYGVREYRPGDNPRRIHWRRTAQTGQLMIREMARIREDQFWCAVDTRVDPRRPEQARAVEQIISAAATVICAVLERGGKIGLVCGGQPPLVLPPGGGRAHRPRLLRELAIREKNSDSDLGADVRRLAWPARWRGACLFFAASDCPDVRASAAALRQAIGRTDLYVPGTAAFSALYADAEAEGGLAVAGVPMAAPRGARP